MRLLEEYRDLYELKMIADQRYKELKRQIEVECKAGRYGDLELSFKLRKVRGYMVAPRVDRIVKVTKTLEVL